MILEVIKQNPSNIPVGTTFKYNKKSGMYESFERHEDIGDTYEFVKQNYYSFSPSFYTFNEEIFNQVKLEEHKDDNVKITEEASETSSTENLSRSESPDSESGIDTPGEEGQLSDRETMEESCEERDCEGDCCDKGSTSGNTSGTEESESNRQKAQRTPDITTVEEFWKRTEDMIITMRKAFDEFWKDTQNKYDMLSNL